MKKKLLCAAALAAGFMFTTVEANAQGAYVKLGAGYNFPAASEIMYNTSTKVSGTTATTSYERVNVNFGQGIPLNLGLGYMFSENVGAELGIGYLLGSKTTVTDTDPTFPTGTEVEENEYYSRMLLIQPSIVISAGGEGISPYARFGMVVGKGTIHVNETYKEDGDEGILEREMSGGWALGLQGGLGIEFGLSDNLGFFAEVNMSNMKYSPDKSEITKATFNGEDVLNDAFPTVSDREIEYLDDIEYVSGTPSEDDEPSKEPKFNLPFGSVGVGVGIKLKF